MLANEQIWWHVARASGIVAWVLSAAAVLWGLGLSTRAMGARPRAPWLLDLHRFLGGFTVVFVGIHLLGLWADSYIEFGLREMLVPMTSKWQPGAVAWGIVAFYLLLAVEITSLIMNRLPKNLWKAVHFSSYLLFATGTVHVFAAGTDAANPVLQITALTLVTAMVFFTLYRFIGPGRVGSIRPSPKAPKEAQVEASVG
jgi:DMSO/TMAO reductase YedYZ heme-binding membrane subunit